MSVKRKIQKNKTKKKNGHHWSPDAGSKPINQAKLETVKRISATQVRLKSCFTEHCCRKFLYIYRLVDVSNRVIKLSSEKKFICIST